ncbi:MAG: DUF433 domain-containing protein [Candidatus Limnocylindrales bacterium]
MIDSVTLAFTTDEARRLTGLSARRLRYWDETDFIRPPVAARQGRGLPRLYSFRDLIQLRVAVQLRDRLSLQALRRLKVALDTDALFATVRFALLPDDQVVYLGPEGHNESARKPGQLVLEFDVPLREIRSSLERDVDRFRARKGAAHVEKRRGVLGNQPVFSGTRIRPESLSRALAAGWSDARILEEYPDLRPADIALVRRGAQASRAG